MVEKYSLEKAHSSPTTATASGIHQGRQHMAQNYLLLWADTNIDQTNQDYENTLKQIRTITGNVIVFKERDACIDFLTNAQDDTKSFLIIKDNIFNQIIPLINDIPQLESVYIFSDVKNRHDEWIKKCDKIKSIHTNIDDLCQALQIGVKQFNQDSIAISFITRKEMAFTENLNQLEPTFMYIQLFKEILLDMKHGEQAIKQFITYCRQNDCASPITIDRFEKEYHPQLAIWWYTYPSFIYSMLNYALRSMDGDTIINMGFFIHDLHQQIQQLHRQQIDGYYDKPFIVYRGQGLSKENFEKLHQTKGGLMSFNSFLSTHREQDIALGLAYSAAENVDIVGILFAMSIDPSIKSAPFASIKEVSYFKEEEEMLFSMQTVFRVNAIKQIDNNNQLYQVELELTSDDDQQLRLLSDRIREEAGGSTGWQRLGILLLKIGQFNKAKELYNVLLEQTSDASERAFHYNHLGCINDDHGDYEKAVWYYEKALEIEQKTLSSNHPDLTTSYNNIGSVYNKMGEYPKALSYYEKALELQQRILPSNHSDLAISYNNIGNVYNNIGDYSKALSFYEKALEIFQKTLPSNHPNSATSYNNIGYVYDEMGEYSKALSFYEKALEIREITLPSSHPSLANSYSNIGNVYNQMKEYSKSLSFYEKALEIFQKTLPSNHPLLATSYNNIGFLYENMKDYSKALSYFERALEIFQRALPPTHPNIKTVKESIEVVKKEL
ncbi:unnamed protein product [Adineta steineri]|nr:unnamed protein product [Adineta steineri]